MDSSKEIGVNNIHVELTQVKEQDVETGRLSIDIAHKYNGNDDDALETMANFQGEPLIVDEATNKRLLSTIDWHLMPILYVYDPAPLSLYLA